MVVGATRDMASREELSLSLYMFRCYLLYLYEVLIVALCSAVVGVDLIFGLYLIDKIRQVYLFFL